MNTKCLLFVLLSVVFSQGCNKSSQPFSANAIQPTQGTIKINVWDNLTPVPNITVKASDPTGNDFSAITDSTGVAVLNPTPFKNGNWFLQVPKQGKYYNSSMFYNFTGVSPSTSVTFQALNPILTLKNINNTYPYGSGSVTYSVGYQPGGNLNVAVTTQVTNMPTTAWTTQFFPPLLGDPSGNTTSQLIITVPNCSYQQPSFQVKASDNGWISNSSSVTTSINRSYEINARLDVTNKEEIPPPYGGYLYTTFWTVIFTTQNDCSTPWDITIWPNNATVNVWQLSGTSFNSGQISGYTSYTCHGLKSGASFTLMYEWPSGGGAVFNSSVSSPIGSGSNSGTVNASWNF
jgi:hypothetical protein